MQQIIEQLLRVSHWGNQTLSISWCSLVLLLHLKILWEGFNFAQNEFTTKRGLNSAICLRGKQQYAFLNLLSYGHFSPMVLLIEGACSDRSSSGSQKWDDCITSMYLIYILYLPMVLCSAVSQTNYQSFFRTRMTCITWRVAEMWWRFTLTGSPLASFGAVLAHRFLLFRVELNLNNLGTVLTLGSLLFRA